jgi:NitT/TauT family transport system substrate-binding protein
MIFLVGTFAACDGSSPTPRPDEITVQLSWFPTVEFAGFYVADHLGYYADENLAVNLVPGGPEANPVEEVLSGEAQFGLASGDMLVRLRDEGENLVCVSSIFRHNPLVVMSLADSGIKTPQDLIGKKVGVISEQLDTTWDRQFLAMLNNAGVDPDEMTLLPIEDYHGANELTSGRLDAASGFFSTNEPVQARRDDHDLSLIFYSDYGVPVYVNPIFTTDAMVAEDPELVERFVRATLRGYEYAISNPEEAADITLEYDDSLDIGLQTATMKAQIPIIDTGDAPLGWMDELTWRVTQDILLSQDVIESPMSVSNFFTNEFVSAAD